jgi:hypothetical protein
MLVGAITSTYLHEGLKFVTPYEQYVGWRNNINLIFMRDQNSPPTMKNMLTGVINLHEGSNFATPYEQYVARGDNITFIFARDQNSPPSMNNMLMGVITSTLSL